MYDPELRQTPLEDDLLGMSEWSIDWRPTRLQKARMMDTYLSAIYASMSWIVWSSYEALSHLGLFDIDFVYYHSAA